MDNHKLMVRGKKQTCNAMKHLFAVLILCCGHRVSAERKLALINDPDGFVNVRTGPRGDFPVIATINENEFFYCGWNQGEEWVPIVALKWKDGRQVEGFMHKTRIKLVKDMGTADQKILLLRVIQQQGIRAEEFLKAWESKDTAAYARSSRIRGEHHDTQYEPVLEGLLPQYICSTKDTIVLNLFYSTVWADRGSASELPSFVMGECFACESDMVVRHVNRLRSMEHRQLLFAHIEWGLLNIFKVDEHGNSKDAKYIQLKKRFNQERSRVTP